MPTLNWIGKDKVVTHHQEIPYKVLEHQYGFRSNDKDNKSADSATICRVSRHTLYNSMQ